MRSKAEAGRCCHCARYDAVGSFDRLRGCSLPQLAAAKSPGRIFGQNSENSVDISKAFFEMVIRNFESSQVSQAVRCSEKLSLTIAERPANGRLLRIFPGLPAPIFGILRAKCPKVSGGYSENSRFGRLRPETGFDLHCVARSQGN